MYNVDSEVSVTFWQSGMSFWPHISGTRRACNSVPSNLKSGTVRTVHCHRYIRTVPADTSSYLALGTPYRRSISFLLPFTLICESQNYAIEFNQLIIILSRRTD